MAIAAVEKGLRGLHTALRVAKLAFWAACVTVTALTTAAAVVWIYASEEERSRYRDVFWAVERVLAPQKLPAGQLSKEELNQLLKKSLWPASLHPQVKLIVRCESLLRPGAIREGKGGLDVGLMQINTRFNRGIVRFVGFEAALLDPRHNLNVGYLVYADAGKTWEPWRASQACHKLLPNDDAPKKKGKTPERLAARE